ncbi:hypothetical protein EVAR_73732_1 [Eumeta japonica]|uniref:Uncharacterized protein n=1 Tax=Eumeta variegata TaxID=151549 RepID=A0A4C1SNW9_EUMVA|nr:hypothetical protein EVAR_73732_1 [Eumeta japonica]
MDYKRRKDFVLVNMEIKDIETETTPDFRKTNRPPRAYQSRFYMRSGGTRGEKVRVCNDFFTKTLLVSRYFLKNAIEFADKATGCYTGSDRRGVHESPNKISDDRKQKVMDHIESYPFWVPNKKSKTRYLHQSLTIKKMFDAYKEKCFTENTKNININYYYKVFHDNFQILFLANPEPKKGWGLLRSNPNISHFTGNEAGGYWIDSKGNKLDISSIDPTRSLNVSQPNLLTNEIKPSSFTLDQFASTSDVSVSNLCNNAALILPLKTLLNQQSSISMLRPTVFGNTSISADPVNL